MSPVEILEDRIDEILPVRSRHRRGLLEVGEIEVFGRLKLGDVHAVALQRRRSPESYEPDCVEGDPNAEKRCGHLELPPEQCQAKKRYCEGELKTDYNCPNDECSELAFPHEQGQEPAKQSGDERGRLEVLESPADAGRAEDSSEN